MQATSTFTTVWHSGSTLVLINEVNLYAEPG